MYKTNITNIILMKRLVIKIGKIILKTRVVLFESRSYWQTLHSFNLRSTQKRHYLEIDFMFLVWVHKFAVQRALFGDLFSISYQFFATLQTTKFLPHFCQSFLNVNKWLLSDVLKRHVSQKCTLARLPTFATLIMVSQLKMIFESRKSQILIMKSRTISGFNLSFFCLKPHSFKIKRFQVAPKIVEFQVQIKRAIEGLNKFLL